MDKEQLKLKLARKLASLLVAVHRLAVSLTIAMVAGAGAYFAVYKPTVLGLLTYISMVLMIGLVLALAKELWR